MAYRGIRSLTAARGILHGTGYVVRPDGTVTVAVYSAGPIGRLVWQDVQ